MSLWLIRCRSSALIPFNGSFYTHNNSSNSSNPVGRAQWNRNQLTELRSHQTPKRLRMCRVCNGTNLLQPPQAVNSRMSFSLLLPHQSSWLCPASRWCLGLGLTASTNISPPRW